MHRKKNVHFDNVKNRRKTTKKKVNKVAEQAKYEEEEEDYEELQNREEQEDDREYSKEISPEAWKMMWVKFLMDLREDELLFTAFQSAMERSQELMNPMMLAASQGMATNMLDKLMTACQLSSDRSDTGVSDEMLAEVKKKMEAEDEEEEEEEHVSPFDENDEDPMIVLKKIIGWGIPIREVKVGSWESQRAWLNQFLMKVNPEDKAIELNMFRFVAADLPDDLKKIMYMGPTQGLVDYFSNEFHRFEVSRQLQLQIPVNTLQGIHYYHSGTDEEFGLIVLQLSTPPIFKTRRLNCSASLKNEWKERIDFTKGNASKYSRVYISGEHNLFTAFFSCLFAVDESLKDIVSKGIDDLGDDTVEYTSTEEKVKTQAAGPRSVPDEILELLVKAQLLGNTGSSLDNLKGNSCFRDYIQHQCESAEDLQSRFDSEVYCDSCDATLTVLRKLQEGCPSKECKAYYSFCENALSTPNAEENIIDHCHTCRSCVDEHYWHCLNCDKCSYGKSIGHCQHCGSSGNEEFINNGSKKLIKKPIPLSVHINSLMLDHEGKTEQNESEAVAYSDVDSEGDQPEWAGWVASEITPELFESAQDDMDGMFGFPGMMGGMEMPPELLQAFAAMSGMNMNDIFGAHAEDDDDDQYGEEEEEEDDGEYDEEQEEEDDEEPRFQPVGEDEDEDRGYVDEEGNHHRATRRPNRRGGPRGGPTPVGCPQQ